MLEASTLTSRWFSQRLMRALELSPTKFLLSMQPGWKLPKGAPTFPGSS